MNSHPPKKIIVGMSGGVDSSVAAFLLKEQGYQVEGVFMKNWEEDDTDTYCPASIDMADAQAVCDKIGIEFSRVNFAAEYWENVFNHFLKEYQNGRTPNPDILCNKEIKFKAFLNYAKQRNADLIATGHYAQISEKGELKKGADPLKDQSYFLHLLSQQQLSNSLFPIGHLPKTEVRDIAKKAGLITHKKKDSTGICFIGERKFKQFLNTYLASKPGNIETCNGTVIGKHDGLMFYTMGQRQGLNIGGHKDFSESPWYVAGKDLTRNVLHVVQGENHPKLFAHALIAKNLHWITETPTHFPLKVFAKTRYRQADQACTIHKEEADSYRIHFDAPQRAITPGQSVVFYQDNICLGGGIIDHALP